MPPSPPEGALPDPARIDRRTTETRERILLAAEHLIAAHGVEGLQIKDVAEAVGIRPPSVFAHFKGRDAIAAEVATHVVDEIGALLIEAFGREDEPMEAARAGVRALVAHLHGHPAHVRLLMRDLAQAGAGEGFHEVGRSIARIDAALRPLLARGVEAGVFRSVDPRPLIPFIEGAILTRLAWTGFDALGQPRLDESVERLQREAEDLIEAYLRAPAVSRDRPRQA